MWSGPLGVVVLVIIRSRTRLSRHAHFGGNAATSAAR